MRSVAPKYANANDFSSGAGAARTGGRWSRKGLAAVYLSLSPTTAAVESYQQFTSLGFAGAVRPRVFIGARVKLARLLDLTSSATRQRLGFSLNELLNENWIAIQEEGDESWTQAIGRGAVAAGFEGLLAPSARDRPKGQNLVIFPGSLLKGSRIEPMGMNELPPHPGPAE